MTSCIDRKYMQDSSFVESLTFNILSAVCILVNSIVIGVEIETGRIDLPVQERISWFVDIVAHRGIYRLGS